MTANGDFAPQRIVRPALGGLAARVPDPPNNGRTKPMTASTPIQTKARNAVADDIVDWVGLTVIDHERDNEGPRGGVSNRILAFATVDGAKVPVVVQVYADERIDELTEEFITRTEAERTRQDRYEEFLASQPIEATAAAIEPGGDPDLDQAAATA